jgi:hypothetical protein
MANSAGTYNLAILSMTKSSLDLYPQSLGRLTAGNFTNKNLLHRVTPFSSKV